MQNSELQFSSFEWDENKRLINIRKHGIDFPIAAAALNEPKAKPTERRSPHTGDLPFVGNLDRNRLYYAGRGLQDHFGTFGTQT